MTERCLFEPALVTPDLVEAAELKAEELFSALVTAKNDWQYAIKDEEKKYLRVLELKAEYAEWRSLAQRLAEMRDRKSNVDAEDLEPARRETGGFAMTPKSPERRTANG